MDRGVPVWTVALAAALVVVGHLAGRHTSRARPALLVLASWLVLAVPLALVDGAAWSTGLLVLAVATFELVATLSHREAP